MTKDLLNFEEFKKIFSVLSQDDLQGVFSLFKKLSNKDFANSSDFDFQEEKQKILNEYLDKVKAINYINAISENENNEELLYNCNICKNKGKYYYIKFEGKYYINLQAENIYCINRDSFSIHSNICTCAEIRKSLDQIKKDGLYKLLKRKHLENFYTEKPFQSEIKELALKYISEIVKGNFPWFYIGGQTGAGKTHISTAIINELLQKGINCRFFDYIQKMDYLKRLQFIDSETFQQSLKDFKKASVLYIDDFFFGNVSDADLKIIFEILNYRYNNDLPCIISSEKILEEVINLSGAIGGRIKESSEGFFIKIVLDNNKNYRLI